MSTTQHQSSTGIYAQKPETNPYRSTKSQPTTRAGLRLQTRNPFDSPNLSLSSLNETDDGSTSGQDEFHLERYSSNAKSSHLRQTSRSTKAEERDAKPELNVITTFYNPIMPMNSQAVLNEVPAKRVRTDRKDKTVSVVSHKAIQSTVSPPADEEKALAAHGFGSGLKGPNKDRSVRHRQNAMLPRDMSPFTQRVPIGITIPKEDAAFITQNPTDSALPFTTPMTPAIVVTPAGDQMPWILQRKGTSDIPQAIKSKLPSLPPVVYAKDAEKTEYQGPRTSHESSETILCDSADTTRPKSQGWWNLMLSPLLRAGSVASRRDRQLTDTPPVPPLPFSSGHKDSPALSARSDPSFLVSSTGTSPETPRRQGLASARTSTWSRWTEWEQERELVGEKNLNRDGQPWDEKDREEVDGSLVCIPAPPNVGLAAEYFHACAVEQVTDRPYFDCVNHSCAQKLPKLHAVYDRPSTKGVVLASPFRSPLDLSSGDDGKLPHAKGAQSPSIVDEDESISPHIREANVASLVKAKSLDISDDKVAPTGEPTMTTTKPPVNTNAAHRDNDGLPNIASITQSSPRQNPAPHIVNIVVTHKTAPPPENPPMYDTKTLASPGPISPEGQKSFASEGGLPLSDMPHPPVPVQSTNNSYGGPVPGRPAFVTADTEYPPLPSRAPTAPITAADLEAKNKRQSIEERRRRLETEDATTKKIGGLWRGRGCFPKNGCMGRGGGGGGPEKRTKRRWIMGISFLLLAIIISCIVLAITLTRRGDGTPVQSQWLNLTGYPPMPTGILTIAAPNLAAQQKQCTQPTTMWSCSVPKEDRDEIGPNQPDQPNFRFEIKFRNGTVPSNMTIPLSSDGTGLSTSAKDPFTNDLFIANPKPPNQPDQIFMGQTTDNISAPFDGEVTPFYITFMPTFPIEPSTNATIAHTRLARRQSNSSLVIGAIPAPDLANDGSAAPASLLPTTPYPISQPVRLYNRGLQDEHYGFYMYYDKSIYLSGFSVDGNVGAATDNSLPEADQDGGCSKSQATAKCTFSQTRFVFKIFTSRAFGADLLSSRTNANLTAPEDVTGKNKTSSATDFERPGSFPYPASVILDRHGGDINSKAIYCYGMQNGQILNNNKTVNGEFRGFGGELVNAAPTLLGSSDNGFNKTAGGIDGGTGGCGCTWQNWQ